MLFVRGPVSVPILRQTSVPLCDGGIRRWRCVPFFRRLGPPPGNLRCKKWRTPPGGTGQVTVKDGSTGDLQRYSLKKNGPEGPNKVGSAGKRGFTRVHARLQGQDIPPL